VKLVQFQFDLDYNFFLFTLVYLFEVIATPISTSGE